MRFRETPVGRIVHRLPGGHKILALGNSMVSPVYGSWYRVKVDRERVLKFKQNVREAYEKLGIRYVLKGSWPLTLSYPPDMRFKAAFPDGEVLDIHLTEERGYQDIDGMAHLNLYRKFATEVLPAAGALPGSTSDRILDCACGSGYGSNFLSETLSCSVTGVDIEKSVIIYANKRYTKVNPLVTYRNGSATDLSFLDTGSIHAIVSIETIEHISDADKALAEYRRVLRPGGVLFVSSPDASERPNTLVSAFHEREYSHVEFETLLKRHFDTVELIVEGDYLLATCHAA